MRQEISLHERGTCENPVDSPMELWVGTGHWDLEVYLRMGHVRIPLKVPSHPTGLWDGTGHWDKPQDGTCENPMDSPVHPMGL